MHRDILEKDQSNRTDILHNFIFERYKYCRRLPIMDQLEYAYSDVIDDSSQQSNREWWIEMKEKCTKFIYHIYKLLEE